MALQDREAVIGRFLRVQKFLYICILNSSLPSSSFRCLGYFEVPPKCEDLGEDRSAAPCSWIIKSLQTASCESCLIIMQLVREATSCILDNSPFQFLVNFSDKLLSEFVANLLAITTYVCIYVCVCVSKMHICCTYAQKFPFCHHLKVLQYFASEFILQP